MEHGLRLELSGGESTQTDAPVWTKKTTTESRKTKKLQQKEAKDPKMTMAVISHITPTSGSSFSVEETCMNVTQKIQKTQN